MAALTLFPLQFKRQDSVPIDIDTTFAATADRTAYLTNARRYAGQIVGDTEDGKVYMLNDTRDAWLPVGSSALVVQDEGSTLTSTAAQLNFVGAGVTATNTGDNVTVTIAGGGGDPLWREERATESTPIDVPAVPTLFQELFTGAAGTFEGKSPDVNFNGQTVTWADDAGDIPSDLSGTGLYIGDDPSLVLKAYGTINGVGVFGEAQTMVVTFVFRTGAQVIPDPDENIEGAQVSVEVGGLNISAGFYYSDVAGGWRVTFDAGTPLEIAAVTSIAANTEYTGVLTINPGAQSLVLLGTTQNTTAAFLNTAGLGRVDVNVCGGGYGISSITIVDPNAADSVIPGIVLDELIPDPTTPPAAVDVDYTRLQAVALPEHELHVGANPFVYDPAILIRKLAFDGTVVNGRQAVDVVASQAGTSVVHLNVDDLEDYQSVHIARPNYLEHFGVTPPTALRFLLTGGETRPFFLQAIDVDPAANGRAYYHGYFYDTIDDQRPDALCVGCIKTANDLPASATNPYTTIVWQTTINADLYFESVSPTKCFAPGFGLVIGAVDRISYYLLFLINLTTGAITWKTRVDIENVNYFRSRMRITTNAVDIAGVLYFYVLYANTVTRYRCSNGVQSLAKELPDPAGYDNGLSAWAGFNGITIDTVNNNYVTVHSVIHDGANYKGYLLRLQPTTLAFYDSIQVYFDAGAAGVDTFAYNGNVIVTRHGVSSELVVARVVRSGASLLTMGPAVRLVAVDGAPLEFNGFSEVGGDTGAGDVNTTGGYPHGEHFSVRKSGNAYDVDIVDMLGGVGNFSSNGNEWQCLATTIGSEDLAIPITPANITMATSATTLVGVSTVLLAIQQPATPLMWVESNHIIPTNVLSELPRPAVKVQGITQTHALRLLGELPVPGPNLIGTLNDRKGDVRADATGVYFCFENYTSGVAPIWRKAPYLSTNNLWNAANNVAAIDLPSGPSITIDATLSNSFIIGLTENLTLNDPTGLVAGQRLHIVFRQFFSGWEVTWGPMFRFATGKPMQVGLGAAAISFMTCYYDGIYLLCDLNIDFVAPPP